MFLSSRAPFASFVVKPILLSRGQMSKDKPVKAKTKLTDTERHKRFKDMAKEVGASEDPKTFEKAFRQVTSRPKK